MTRYASFASRAGTRLLAVALAIGANPGKALEVHPQDSYVTAGTLLGAVGGGVLGASLGGLSRSRHSGTVTPLLRWGAAGTVMGSLVARQAALDLVARSRLERDAPPPVSRDVGACLGAFLGEAAGFAAAAAITPPSRSSRTMWSSVALGAVVGAGAGFLLRPLAFLAPPPPTSRREHTEADGLRRISRAPDVPVHVKAFIDRAEPAKPGHRPTPTGPFSPDQQRALEAALRDPESRRVLPEVPDEILPPRAVERMPGLSPDRELLDLSRLVTRLALIEGAVLGAAAGGSLSGGEGRIEERAGAGAAAGALVGLSIGSALAGPLSGDTLHRPYVDRQDLLERGHRAGGMLVGGLMGTLVGAGVGALLVNLDRDFEGVDAVRVALAGNVGGLIAGYVLVGPRTGDGPVHDGIPSSAGRPIQGF